MFEGYLFLIPTVSGKTISRSRRSRWYSFGRSDEKGNFEEFDVEHGICKDDSIRTCRPSWLYQRKSWGAGVRAVRLDPGHLPE